MPDITRFPLRLSTPNVTSSTYYSCHCRTPCPAPPTNNVTANPRRPPAFIVEPGGPRGPVVRVFDYIAKRGPAARSVSGRSGRRRHTPSPGTDRSPYGLQRQSDPVNHGHASEHRLRGDDRARGTRGRSPTWRITLFLCRNDGQSWNRGGALLV